MKGVCIFQTIYMSIWGCMHFAYGTKHIKICPFQTGQLLKETDYNGATLRDKEKAEKKPTVLFRLLSRFFTHWFVKWFQPLILHFLYFSFRLAFLSRKADTSYSPKKDYYLPTWKNFSLAVSLHVQNYPIHYFHIWTITLLYPSK